MPPEDGICVDPEDAHRWTLALMDRVGVPPQDAQLLVDGLIQANLCGMDAHGNHSGILARSTILLANTSGTRIPARWALDETGSPTEDPQAALKGTMAPVGGHKGFGLALMVDVLSGLLGGAASSQEVGDLFRYEGGPQNVGHYFQAIDLQRLGHVEEFRGRMDGLIRQLRSAPTAPGVDRIRLPGDVERETAAARRQQGIPLGRELAGQLRRLGDRYRVPWPCQQARCGAAGFRLAPIRARQRFDLPAGRQKIPNALRLDAFGGGFDPV